MNSSDLLGYCIFVIKLNFIPPRKEKKCILHSELRHSCNMYINFSLHSIHVIYLYIHDQKKLISPIYWYSQNNNTLIICDGMIQSSNIIFIVTQDTIVKMMFET